MRFVLTVLIVTLFTGDLCCAQGLFGERTLGRSLGRRAGPGAAAAGSASGVVSEGQRFLRGEREATNFVGSSAGGGGASGFVGGTTAVTSAVSSVAGLTQEVRPPLNRPRIVRTTGLYPERLSLGDDELQTASDSRVSAPPVSSAVLSVIQMRGLTIEVSPEERSATLRGVVPSEHERQTTELLVMLEPSIQNVRNELTVDPNCPPVPMLRRPARGSVDR